MQRSIRMLFVVSILTVALSSASATASKKSWGDWVLDKSVCVGRVLINGAVTVMAASTLRSLPGMMLQDRIGPIQALMAAGVAITANIVAGISSLDNTLRIFGLSLLGEQRIWAHLVGALEPTDRPVATESIKPRIAVVRSK